MEPVSAVTAAMKEGAAQVLSESGEIAREARETLLGESGLIDQLDTIRHQSLESVIARNEAAIGELSLVEVNRLKGYEREVAVLQELQNAYPKEAGYRVESQCVLRDETGRIVLDPETGESRRVDFVVSKDGQVVKSVEVTSETADKTVQMAKEHRIREAGGNYIRDRETGELVFFPPHVRTEIMRRV
ncbi:MAG: hypothetical protein NZ578_05965 [Candidatus Binatia bacterium]|nr:hypothetical protein [Candidatus Binatia bacterium]